MSVDGTGVVSVGDVTATEALTAKGIAQGVATELSKHVIENDREHAALHKRIGGMSDDVHGISTNMSAVNGKLDAMQETLLEAVKLPIWLVVLMVTQFGILGAMAVWISQGGG